MLVVDDDVVDRQSIRRMLDRAAQAFEVTEVETAGAAMATLGRDRELDCVLLDHNLPDEEGLSLLARLRQEGGASAPVIMLTGHESDGLAERCLHEGAQDYLVKGRFDQDGLVRAIRWARERFSLTRELAAKAQALARSNVELERFAYVASHDLQEPLRTLSAMGERLGERFDAQLGPEGTELVKRMNDAARRMRTLVDDLLELSRASRGEAARRRVELKPLFEQLRKDLAARFDETGAELRLPPTLPAVQADVPQLARLFLNLVGNSLKFCAPGRAPVVSVTATLGRRGADRPVVELVLEDNGIGFDPSQAEAIFEPFKRLQPRTRYPGTGMGLALARAIVERHGGRIRAEGRPGQGASFHLTLPAADAS